MQFTDLDWRVDIGVLDPTTLRWRVTFPIDEILELVSKDRRESRWGPM